MGWWWLPKRVAYPCAGRSLGDSSGVDIGGIGGAPIPHEFGHNAALQIALVSSRHAAAGVFCGRFDYLLEPLDVDESAGKVDDALNPFVCCPPQSADVPSKPRRGRLPLSRNAHRQNERPPLPASRPHRCRMRPPRVRRSVFHPNRARLFLTRAHLGTTINAAGYLEDFFS